MLEKLDRLCSTFACQGVNRLRPTDGEPPVRRGIMRLFRGLACRIENGVLEKAHGSRPMAVSDRAMRRRWRVLACAVSISFQHKLSGTIMACIGSGFAFEAFNQHAHDFSGIFENVPAQPILPLLPHRLIARKTRWNPQGRRTKRAVEHSPEMICLTAPEAGDIVTNQPRRIGAKAKAAEA